MNKKQERRLARMQERENQSTKDKSSKQTKTAITWLITFAVIIGIVWGLVVMVRNSSGGDVVATSEEITSEDWTIGNPEAPIHIIEYSDFQCPACGAYEPLIKEVLSEYGDKIYFAYRHFPLRSIHPHAQLTAQASEAAGLQGKFWEMHEQLFENQSTWAIRPNIDSILSDMAEAIGLDLAQFEADLSSDIAKAAVDSDYASATGLGLNSTPTFILNGNKIPNPAGLDQFKAVIDQALLQVEAETK